MLGRVQGLLCASPLRALRRSLDSLCARRMMALTSAAESVQNCKPSFASLPTLHKDPVDRILVAQSMAERLGLVTNDGPIKAHSVQTFW